MTSNSKSYGIVGGGLIGLATAYAIARIFPRSSISLYEKEDNLCLHQSGNNSGVLHCGLYYAPNSLKAHLAVSGIREMIAFCEQHSIAHEVCGKVVVASDEIESKRLLDLADRGTKNGLKGLTFLNNQELKKREPYVKAHTALLVPEEGIADYKAVGQKLAELIQDAGGKIFLKTKVLSCTDSSNSSMLLHTNSGDFLHDKIIFCSGLHSDRVFKNCSKSKLAERIIPFRGEYYTLTAQGGSLFNHLIYPVPDPQFPFLGVHFTRMFDGIKEVGPNAVLAFKREGYKLTDFSLLDTIDSLSYIGLLKFLRKNFAFSLGELATSVSKVKFLLKARKLIPDIDPTHFMGKKAGVRAQTLSNSGDLVMDFLIKKVGNQIHVLNAPSPGATSCLAIGKHITENYIN